MKKPRVEDFDPDTAPTLKSSLDDMPPIAKPTPYESLPSRDSIPGSPQKDILPPGSTGGRPLEEPPVRTPVAPPVRTPVRFKRTITRYAFEFFQDQVATLQAYSLEEKMRGDTGSMSKMIREAVDAYIAKRKAMEE